MESWVKEHILGLLNQRNKAKIAWEEAVFTAGIKVGMEVQRRMDEKQGVIVDHWSPEFRKQVEEIMNNKGV